MTDSETNSCSWSKDSLPLDVELSFPVIGSPVAPQNAVETVELTSHMDQNRPNIDSYTARVRHNLPEDVELANPPLRRRADYLSAFKREHFDMYNVTPERVTSAFFPLPDSNATMQHIFDGLLTDGIPSRAVRCLQHLPNGKVDITFGTQEMQDQFLRRSVFTVNRRPYAAHPAQRRLTFVTILDAPYELTERALEYCLQKYGRVYSQRRGKIQSHPSVCNGLRHIRMDIHTDIPSSLRFGKFLLRVFYEGQPETCRRCNSPDHLAKDCKNTFCFNRESIGHVSKQCPSNVKCCICKEESHKAIDCRCIKCEDLLLNCANVILGILTLCLPGHLCRSCAIEVLMFDIVVSSTFHRKTVLLNAQTVQNINK